MMGEPVVRAFRMEKLAGPDTGHILACQATGEAAGPGLAFRALGEQQPQGLRPRRPRLRPGRLGLKPVLPC